MYFGDEITPDSLHETLYGPENDLADDVHIRLNSYGGSCNAAVRMYDDIRAYRGNVSITVSGTAASAATMLCMAADKLEITPGSLWMIHDPAMLAFGNERDMEDAKAILHACKQSILNMYERRITISRDEADAMMSAATWMDAKEALDKGFVDMIVEDPIKSPVNRAENRTVSREAAEASVKAWFDRRSKPLRQITTKVANASNPLEPVPKTDKPIDRVSVSGTDEKLEALLYC